MVGDATFTFEEIDYGFFPREYQERVKRAFAHPNRYGNFQSPRFFPDGGDGIKTHRDLLKVVGICDSSELHSRHIMLLLEAKFMRLPEIGKKTARSIAGYVLVKGLDEFIRTN